MQLFRSRADRDFELLSSYLDGELSSRARRQLIARLQHEPDLQRTLDELNTTHDMLHELPEVPLPHNFMLTPEQVRAIRPLRPANGPWLQLATAAVAVMFAIVVVSDLTGSTFSTPLRPIQDEAPLSIAAEPELAAEGAPAAGAISVEAPEEAPAAADAGAAPEPLAVEETIEVELQPEAEVVVVEAEATDATQIIEDAADVLEAPAEAAAPAEESVAERASTTAAASAAGAEAPTPTEEPPEPDTFAGGDETDVDDGSLAGGGVAPPVGDNDTRTETGAGGDAGGGPPIAATSTTVEQQAPDVPPPAPSPAPTQGLTPDLPQPPQTPLLSGQRIAELVLGMLLVLLLIANLWHGWHRQ